LSHNEKRPVTGPGIIMKAGFLIEFTHCKVFPFAVKLKETHYGRMGRIDQQPIEDSIMHSVQYKVLGVSLPAQGAWHKGIIKIKDFPLSAVRQV